MRRPWFALLVPVLLAGCDVLDPVACTTDLRPHFRTSVVDSLTRFGIAQIASGVAVGGGREIDLLPAAGDSLHLYEEGVAERAGTYTVTVEAPGYETWSKDVRVSGDECHVIAQDVQAQLIPAGGPVTLFADSAVETYSATELPVTVAVSSDAGRIIVSGTAGQSPRCPQIGVSAELWGQLLSVQISHVDGCDDEPHHGITYRYVYDVPPGVYRAVVDDPWIPPPPAVDHPVEVGQ